MSEKKPTRQAEIVFAAMKAIEANGGEMRISDIYATLASSFPLTDYEKEETKSGVIRWKAYLNFYSIEVGKVGYLVKKSGIWHLTEEGAKALAAGAGEFFADFHGKFSKIQKEARNGHRCLRLIDIDEFIDLWIRYYDRMSEEDKALLPIIPVYFLKA